MYVHVEIKQHFSWRHYRHCTNRTAKNAMRNVAWRRISETVVYSGVLTLVSVQMKFPAIVLNFHNSRGFRTIPRNFTQFPGIVKKNQYFYYKDVSAGQNWPWMRSIFWYVVCIGILRVPPRFRARSWSVLACRDVYKRLAKFPGITYRIPVVFLGISHNSREFCRDKRQYLLLNLDQVKYTPEYLKRWTGAEIMSRYSFVYTYIVPGSRHHTSRVKSVDAAKNSSISSNSWSISVHRIVSLCSITV
jgi:hypothetical protein